MVFNRRQFLCGASALTLATPLFLGALATEADAATNNILVIVNLTGGNDGFNTVVPISASAYGAYMDQRPTIGLTMSQFQQYGTAFDTNTSTPSAQATTFAFNPSMGSMTGATNNLRALYGRGKVAVINGVGLPVSCGLREDHAGAQLYWAIGDPSGSNASGLGWAGTAIDTLHANIGPPVQLVSLVGYQTALTSSTTNQVCIGDLASFGYSLGGFYNQPATANTILSGVDGYALPTAVGETARSVNNNTLGLVSTLKGYANAEPLSDYTTSFTPYSGSINIFSYFKAQLKTAAQMILAQAPTRIFYTGFGTYFDTHGAQNANNYHNNLLQYVSEGITEFYTYLAARNASRNVLIMTISDFGRRAYENSSAGTDHGSSSVNFLIGDAVRGGVYGQYPGLASAQLDANGDTLVPVDFRTNLAVGAQWLGADPNIVLASGFPSVASAFGTIIG